MKLKQGASGNIRFHFEYQGSVTIKTGRYGHFIHRNRQEILGMPSNFYIEIEGKLIELAKVFGVWGQNKNLKKRSE
jgi:hypothetical protein